MRDVRCDLHVHSRFSTDSGNFALRRARLGESFTEPDRIHRVSRARGMSLVTISDHNTLEGALRIAHLPGVFLSVEVTTRFPEDDVPLHVLVWNLTEEDHRELQPLRPSVYELVDFLRARRLPHALAHPLYRMGPPLTPSHVERMMLLFSVWEGRNGARPAEANELAGRLARAVTPDYLAKLADRHGMTPRHEGSIGLTGGSDDHGAVDIATTWTQAGGETPAEFLASVMAGTCGPGGAHGSTLKLAHAVTGLFLNAWRANGNELPSEIASELEGLFDDDAEDAEARHREISETAGRVVRVLSATARDGGLELGSLSALPRRLGALALAGAINAPYFATAQHHAGSRAGVRELEAAFFGVGVRSVEPRALVFTDTLGEANGVAGTMRRLADAGAAGRLPVKVVASGGETRPGVVSLEPDWAVAVPAYESIELRFPSPTDVLSLVEKEQPDVIHVATPGPVGACGLLSAKLLGIPVVGSWHTELGPYALHLTRDLLVAEAFERYVDWFYRQCVSILAPTRAVADALAARGLAGRVGLWGRGVDSDRFSPGRRTEAVRRRLLGDGDLVLLSVGRISREKRLDVLVDAFDRARDDLPGLRLVIVGDGPAREELEASAPEGVRFLGELRGDELAAAYASADLFCFPSTTDTFGQVLLEAAAAGLPTVAAAAGGANELVLEGRTGRLVPPDDVDAFASAVSELASSPRLREELGLRARSHALARTWDDSFEELRAAYAAATGLVTPSSLRRSVKA
jgi:glycosyltransferase involved in cell wall biosynthesis/predicted metal-dependent phosphoesterase TrpH